MSSSSIAKCEALSLSIVLLICYGLFSALGCPKVCDCKWKYGKIWVICSNAKFIDVPQGLESSTQVLDLSNNNLQILFRDAFIDRGLVNLQKVFLVNCKLRKLDDHCFRKLANLVELNLSYNSLSVIPSKVLADIPGLRELRMKRNNLVTVTDRAFKSVPDLVHLDLSFNTIQSIHEKAFSELKHLEVLKLSGNKLTTIDREHLQSLRSLHELDLHANLWHCDCNLRSAVSWLRLQNLALSALPRCWKPPQLSKLFWKDVDPSKLFCMPKVVPLAPRILVTNGENVTLSCKAETIDSEAQVTWRIKTKPYINKTLLFSDEPRYNVFEIVTTKDRVQKTVSNLTISEADFHDEGVYRCLVENEAGIVETNLTLQVSEEIREDPLVDSGRSYITGTIAGVIVTLSLAVIFCISAVTYRNVCQKSQRINEEKIPFQEKGEFVSSVTTETLTCHSDLGNESSIGQNQRKDGTNTHLLSKPKSSCKYQDQDEVYSRISYLELAKKSSEYSDTGEWKTGAMMHYPDILLRSKRNHQFCTLARRSNTICGKSYQKPENKYPKEQISRSSSCLHDSQKNVSSSPEPCDYLGSTSHAHSLETLHMIDGLTLSSRSTDKFNEEYKYRINADQLSRILQEYTYMKKELRRLKEIERKKGRTNEETDPPSSTPGSELMPQGILTESPSISSHQTTMVEALDSFPSSLFSMGDISPRPITPPPQFHANAQENQEISILDNVKPRNSDMVQDEQFFASSQYKGPICHIHKIPLCHDKSESRESNLDSKCECSVYRDTISNRCKFLPPSSEPKSVFLAFPLDRIYETSTNVSEPTFKL